MEKDSDMFRIKLKELRESKGLSQAALAKELHITQGAIGNWESGTREPNIEMINKLSEYFGVSVDYLLGRDELSVSVDSNKDNIDIQDRLNMVLSELDNGALFNGEPLDPDSRELMAASIERTLRIAKELQQKRQSEDDVN